MSLNHKNQTRYFYIFLAILMFACVIVNIINAVIQYKAGNLAVMRYSIIVGVSCIANAAFAIKYSKNK